jgi:phosphatidylglycerol---prolipoprotein diacylglyceryl transferase
MVSQEGCMYPVLVIGPFELDSYILFYALAYVVVALLLKREFAKRQYSTRLLVAFLVTGLLSGLIGAKIYYILENWDAFIVDPFPVAFSVYGSGWYGGFILGGIGIVLFLKINRLPVLRFLDILAPAIPVGQVFGRLGCFFAGCCHGTPSSLPWALEFPHSLYPPHVKLHPAQLYEVIVCLAISVLLFRMRSRNLKDGILMGLYLLLAGVGRFAVEFYRMNPRVVAQLTAPQVVALVGVIVGGVLIIRAYRSMNALSDLAGGEHRPIYIQGGRGV